MAPGGVYLQYTYSPRSSIDAKTYQLTKKRLGTVVLNLGHNVKIAGELGAVLIIIGVLLLIATTGLYHLLFSLPGVASA